MFSGSVHNEAKPIFYFGYLGGKEGAIQCACGREVLGVCLHVVLGVCLHVVLGVCLHVVLGVCLHVA